MPRPEAPALPSRDVLQLKAGGTASRLPRALALGVVYSLPLVSVPFLPFVRASAVAPAVILFAGALVMVTVVQRVRAGSISVVDAALMIGALAAIGISWIPVLLDLSAYSSSTSIVVARVIRAVLPPITAGIVFAAFRAIVRTPGLGRDLLATHLVRSGVIYAGIGLMSIATAAGLPGISDAYVFLREIFTTSGDEPIGGLRRVTGLAYEPSFAGFEYTAWWLPVSIALAFTRRYRAIGLVLTAVFLVCALGTQSITALICLVALVIVLVGPLLRRVKSGAVAGIIITTGVIGLAALAGTPTVSKVIGRLTVQVPDIFTGRLLERGPRDPSLSERSALLHNAVNVAVAHPIIGAGFGLAGYRFDEFRPEWTYRNTNVGIYESYLAEPDGSVFPSAKNLYVRVWSETGVIGLTVLLALIAVGFGRGARYLRRSRSGSGREVWLGVALILGLFSSSVAYLSLDSFGIPYLWAWLGVASGVADHD